MVGGVVLHWEERRKSNWLVCGRDRSKIFREKGSDTHGNGVVVADGVVGDDAVVDATIFRKIHESQ